MTFDTRVDPVDPVVEPLVVLLFCDTKPETLCCFLDAEQTHACVVFVVEAA